MRDVPPYFPRSPELDHRSCWDPSMRAAQTGFYVVDCLNQNFSNARVFASLETVPNPAPRLGVIVSNRQLSPSAHSNCFSPRKDRATMSSICTRGASSTSCKGRRASNNRVHSRPEYEVRLTIGNGPRHPSFHRVRLGLNESKGSLRKASISSRVPQTGRESHSDPSSGTILGGLTRGHAVHRSGATASLVTPDINLYF